MTATTTEESVIFVEATIEDAEAIKEYNVALFQEPNRTSPVRPDEYKPTVEEKRDTIKNYTQQKNSIYLLARCGEQLVGELTLKGYPLADIQHNATLGMSVHRDWRRRGVGRQLLKKAIEWAREGGIIRRIELFTFSNNKAAQTLYLHMGFVQEGIRRDFVHLDGEYVDDILMAYYINQDGNPPPSP